MTTDILGVNPLNTSLINADCFVGVTRVPHPSFSEKRARIHLTASD